MNNHEFAIGFFNVFNPESHKYVIRDSLGQIRTVKAQLSVELVENSLKPDSQEVISFFSRQGMIDYFGIDIDDHGTNGWIDNVPTGILEERFNLAKKIIGETPSLVFKSPRGIHAYWFFEKPMPNLTVHNILKELFEYMHHIEILPTNRHSLRIPSPEEYLNNDLGKCGFSGFESLVRYPNEAIFRNDLRYWNKNESQTDKVKNAKRVNYAPISMVQLENKVMPLKSGHTNDVYIKLVAKYMVCGLDEKQAYDRFVNLVKSSPGYSGQLLTNLKARIKTSYKRMADINISQMKPLPELYREPFVRKTVDGFIKEMGLDVPKRSRMKKSMISFLLNIISWKSACDKRFGNHETAYYWDYLYPGSWWNHKEGYYPLPYSLLRKWNSHYDRPMRLLRELGVLEESPCHYSSTLKRCKYYRIKISCGHLI